MTQGTTPVRKWGEFLVILPCPMPLSPFESLVTRCFSGVFHTPPRKSAFFLHFLRFFLAFCNFLGYIPLRPGLFTAKHGVVSSRPPQIRIRVKQFYVG